MLFYCTWRMFKNKWPLFQAQCNLWNNKIYSFESGEVFIWKLLNTCCHLNPTICASYRVLGWHVYVPAGQKHRRFSTARFIVMLPVRIFGTDTSFRLSYISMWVYSNPSTSISFISFLVFIFFSFFLFRFLLHELFFLNFHRWEWWTFENSYTDH